MEKTNENYGFSTSLPEYHSSAVSSINNSLFSKTISLNKFLELFSPDEEHDCNHNNETTIKIMRFSESDVAPILVSSNNVADTNVKFHNNTSASFTISKSVEVHLPCIENSNIYMGKSGTTVSVLMKEFEDSEHKNHSRFNSSAAKNIPAKKNGASAEKFTSWWYNLPFRRSIPKQMTIDTICGDCNHPKTNIKMLDNVGNIILPIMQMQNNEGNSDNDKALSESSQSTNELSITQEKEDDLIFYLEL